MMIYIKGETMVSLSPSVTIGMPMVWNKQIWMWQSIYLPTKYCTTFIQA